MDGFPGRKCGFEVSSSGRFELSVIVLMRFPRLESRKRRHNDFSWLHKIVKEDFNASVLISSPHDSVVFWVVEPQTQNPVRGGPDGDRASKCFAMANATGSAQAMAQAVLRMLSASDDTGLEDEGYRSFRMFHLMHVTTNTSRCQTSPCSHSISPLGLILVDNDRYRGCIIND